MRLSRGEIRELRAIECALRQDPQLALVFHESGSSFRYPVVARRRLAVIALIIGMVLLGLGSSSGVGMVLMGVLAIVLGGLALSGSAGAAGRRRAE